MVSIWSPNMTNNDQITLFRDNKYYSGLYVNEITTQRLHLRPNVSTLRSRVFIRGDLMLKLMTLHTVKVTSSTNKM